MKNSQDQSERDRNSNDALSESEQRFRTLVTATSDVVYRMSPDWSVMRQLDGGSFLSDTGEPIENWLEKYIHPLDQEMVKAAIENAVETKSIFQLEHRVLRSDGSLGWTCSNAVPIFDNENRITEWFGSATDITERKRMEEDYLQSRDAAEHQKQLYESVTTNTPDLIYVFGLDYRFNYANPALLTMWGKSWDEAIPKTLLENGYEPWHAEMHEREIDHIVATKEQVRGEVGFPHATLGMRVYDYILTPVINANGEVTAVSGVTRDISNIKENERRKNDFISMVSHELKTPLTSSISYIQVSQKKAVERGDTVAASMLERAGLQLAKMTRMINGFLNISRLESGKLQIDLKNFNLADLVKEIEENTLVSVTTHKVSFASVEEIWVNADREKIAQVFDNLIGNAVKYSPPGSMIDVRCKKSEGVVTISIEDHGMGIKEEEIPRLFERYYRTKNVEASHIAGFGIGLYLSSEIVKLHGGDIWAESKVNEGSIFSFTLPAL